MLFDSLVEQRFVLLVQKSFKASENGHVLDVELEHRHETVPEIVKVFVFVVFFNAVEQKLVVTVVVDCALDLKRKKGFNLFCSLGNL